MNRAVILIYIILAVSLTGCGQSEKTKEEAINISWDSLGLEMENRVDHFYTKEMILNKTGFSEDDCTEADVRGVICYKLSRPYDIKDTYYDYMDFYICESSEDARQIYDMDAGYMDTVDIIEEGENYLLGWVVVPDAYLEYYFYVTSNMVIEVRLAVCSAWGDENPTGELIDDNEDFSKELIEFVNQEFKAGDAIIEERIPEFSDEYLVGFSFGGSGWGEFYDCIDADVIICTNHDVLMYMPTLETLHDKKPEMVLVETLKLTDEQYHAIENAVDREKLYTMVIESNDNVDDGDSYGLILYDRNEEMLKYCGGYMPTTKEFNDIYDEVMNNIPREEMRKIHDDYVDMLRNEDK